MNKKEIKKVISERISKEQVMELYNIAKEKYPDDIGDISLNPISWSLFIDGLGEMEFRQNQDIYNYLRRILK